MGDTSVNQSVSDRLREAADLLQQQGANPFRIGAYRRAADYIVLLDRGLDDLLSTDGPDGLSSLPHIGRGITSVIVEILSTGRWGQLDRLRGTLEPEKLFQSIPAVGPRLAAAIHDTLHVDSLEALEAAAHDGRLEKVKGVGPRRAAAIRASLGSMLGRVIRRSSTGIEGPGVEILLDVDREYRDLAELGRLPTISPRRFNPDGTARLPILHTTREPWHFTALFSNTARAHDLDRTRDWVVVYFYDDQQHEGQHTVVTETHGALIGRRVVRGREKDCFDLYRRR